MDRSVQAPACSVWLARAVPHPYQSRCRRPRKSDRLFAGSRSSGFCVSSLGSLRPVPEKALLGPGLPRVFGVNNSRYLRFTKSRWILRIVEGLRIIAAPNKRAGRIKIAQKPTIYRSLGRRSGARFLDRLSISSWCFTSSDSATTDRVPPGPSNRATVTTRCMKSIARSRITESPNHRITESPNHRNQINGDDKTLKSLAFFVESSNSPPNIFRRQQFAPHTFVSPTHD